MAFKSAKEPTKKKKFAGGLAFMAFFIVVACLIYLPWERYLPIAPPPQDQAPAVTDPNAAAPPPDREMSVEARLAYERYGRPQEDKGFTPAWYNDRQIFMLTIAAQRQSLAASNYTIVVLVGLVLPFSLFFFMK
jgi:hypothetical protein